VFQALADVGGETSICQIDRFAVGELDCAHVKSVALSMLTRHLAEDIIAGAAIVASLALH
jgi:hypothetical protein